MDEIYNRIVKHNLCLSNTGRANMCLGYLWSRFQQSTYENNVSVNDILNQIAPEIDGSRIVAKLYTEWGIWKRDLGNNPLAEEKYRIVIDNYPTQLPARTELGKLLSKQKGREKEAEEVLREVIKIDKKDLHARTVLAKLYEDCNRQREAVALYQEVCKYNPGNPYGEQGLERLKKYINN